ncbi:MAG: leucine-rich repeat domain-containing protein [Simkania sp.]|nr:leucine-rich repeat domain-containing protein [Simkania sp.]MCP5490021.1 leucine-rich repeat domain-containing protein [Chlamydiales bacterium]
MSSVQYYEGGYYCYHQTHLDLCFQVNPTKTGLNRICEIPQASVSSLFVDQWFDYVKYLLELYKSAILTIAKQWDLTLEGTSLEVSEKFSSLIVAKEYHKMEKLSLKGLGLSSLPPQIGLFKDLKELDLSGNNLVILFPELTRLDSLEVLDISGNQVGTMLPDLSGLPNLRGLRANRCGLGAVPEWLNRCPKLEFVELHGNGIEDSIRLETRYHLTL